MEEVRFTPCTLQSGHWWKSMLPSRLGVLATLLTGRKPRACPSLRAISFRADNPDAPSEEDQKEVRQWLAGFTPSTIPRRICHLNYSRSSGPGGQNVNK